MEYLRIICNALEGYIEDSAGKDSQEANDIENAWGEILEVLLEMPNGFVSFKETFYEVVSTISAEMGKDEPSGKVAEVHEDSGGRWFI